MYAANLTDIDITIPSQPKWTGSDIQRLRINQGSKIGRGSALAWMGHLHALRWFLNSTLETAVILEDDVDWSIHLRDQQIPYVSHAFRRLMQNPPGSTRTKLNSNPPPHSTSHPKPHSRFNFKSSLKPSNLHPRSLTTPNTLVPPPIDGERAPMSDYWGPPSKWEILYLGHCGDYFPAHRFRNNLAYEMFEDQTLPPVSKMHEQTQKFWHELELPGQRRLVHRSVWPLCTFAYAVNRRSAARILAEFDREEEGKGTPAYDVRLLEACRDLGWLCYTVNPELFHHHDGPSEIAVADQHARLFAVAAAAAADDTTTTTTTTHGRELGAPNIACGARSDDFFSSDPDALRYLRRNVGAKGRCLADRMQQSMGAWP